MHYACWLTVRFGDMINLNKVNTDVNVELAAGNFVVNRPGRGFSSREIDHEQNNSWVKVAGGAIGLITNESALQRGMITGLGVARLIEEFQQFEPNAHEENNFMSEGLFSHKKHLPN